jgi:hypothetical protein
MEVAMKRIATITLVFAVLLAVGCAGPVVKPETVPQSLLYGYGLLDGVSGSVQTLYKARVIPYDEAKNSLDMLSQAKASLDKAKELYYIGETIKAKGEVDAAMGVLELIRNHLLERSMK